MKQLYTTQAAQKWTARTGRMALTALLTGGLALLLCILLCTQVTTGNAQGMSVTVITVSTLAGWAVILLLRFGYLPAKAQREHITGVMSEAAEEHQGVLTLDRQRWIIPHSVAFFKVTLRSGSEARIFSINAPMARELPPNGTPVRVLTVRKFITAYEVQHEEDQSVC